MKKVRLFFFLTFLLTSCAPAATTVPTFTPQPTETITLSATAAQTPNPTPTIRPTPTQFGGGEGKFIFEYYKVAFEKSFPNLEGDIHVFTSNPNGTDLNPVTNGLKDFNHIESISVDSRMALISSHPTYPAKGDLYLIRLNLQDSNPRKIASGLAWSRWPQAIFLDDTHIVYLGQGSKGYAFYTANIDGTDPKKLGAPDAKYAGIVSSDKTRIYYEGITKEYFKDSFGILYAYGDTGSLWWINTDGSGQGKLESNGHQIFEGNSAFSPDGTNIAWIPGDIEPGCSSLGDAFWTPDIRNGTYTKSMPKFVALGFISKDSPHIGKVIDTAYVEDYVRHCFILHVASLSSMDNDIKIPLIPPFNPTKDNFYYHKDYVLRWWPDSSKILAYDGGSAMGRWWDGVADHYPMTLYMVAPKDPNPGLDLLKVLSNGTVVHPPGTPGTGLRFADSFSSFSFSPDGRQLLFAQYSNDHQGSTINILNLETMDYIHDFSHNITPDFQIERVGNIYWLP